MSVECLGAPVVLIALGFSLTKTCSQVNSKFAASYTSEQWQKDLVNQVAAFILANMSWIGVDFLDPASTFEKPTTEGKHVRVLDYACGPGTITHALAGRASEYVGIDLSENMVKAYNLRFNPESETDNEGEQLNAHAVVGNLLVPDDSNLSSFQDSKYQDFDLVVVGMGYHHFSDLPLTTARLTDRLKPGGVFLIVDFISHPPETDRKHPAAHTVAHHGFNEERVKEIFEGAGLKDFEMRVWPEKVILRNIEPRDMFLAKGRKDGAQKPLL